MKKEKKIVVRVVVHVTEYSDDFFLDFRVITVL